MAKQIIKIERKKLLENIKKGEFHMSKTKVLQEDVNTQILLAIEICAASRKTTLAKQY